MIVGGRDGDGDKTRTYDGSLFIARWRHRRHRDRGQASLASRPKTHLWLGTPEISVFDRASKLYPQHSFSNRVFPQQSLPPR